MAHHHAFNSRFHKLKTTFNGGFQPSTRREPFVVLQPLRWRCVKCVIHHERNAREEQQYIYMWREKAIIEWSWHVNSIVACCYSAKLCAYAARAFPIATVAATMLRRFDPTKERVEPATFSTTLTGSLWSVVGLRLGGPEAKLKWGPLWWCHHTHSTVISTFHQALDTAIEAYVPETTAWLT